MYTEPVIKSLSGRAYIEYYFNGERQREYNGKRLSLTIFPNKAKNQPDKVRLLNKLKFELRKALDKGWNPLTVNRAPDKKKALNLESAIKDVLHAKLADNYSRTYKRDLQDIAGKLLSFLSPAEKKGSASSISDSRITEFLLQFNTSNRNYMNKRQTLNVFLPGVIKVTPKKKCVEKLHEIYEKDKLKLILEFLKDEYPRLYIVALLAYGCFLRPHEESRQLQKRHVRARKIYLSGDENKGRRVRVVNIPDYVYCELEPYIASCDKDTCYLLTGSDWLLNNDYFKTQWTRAKRLLRDRNLTALSREERKQVLITEMKAQFATHQKSRSRDREV